MCRCFLLEIDATVSRWRASSTPMCVSATSDDPDGIALADDVASFHTASRHYSHTTLTTVTTESHWPMMWHHFTQLQHTTVTRHSQQWRRNHTGRWCGIISRSFKTLQSHDTHNSDDGITLADDVASFHAASRLQSHDTHKSDDGITLADDVASFHAASRLQSHDTHNSDDGITLANDVASSHAASRHYSHTTLTTVTTESYWPMMWHHFTQLQDYSHTTLTKVTTESHWPMMWHHFTQLQDTTVTRHSQQWRRNHTGRWCGIISRSFKTLQSHDTHNSDDGIVLADDVASFHTASRHYCHTTLTTVTMESHWPMMWHHFTQLQDTTVTRRSQQWRRNHTGR